TSVRSHRTIRSGQFFFFSSRRRHTRSLRDWSSDVCSSDLGKLTDEEWAQIMEHPTTGFRELSERGDLSWAQLMVVYQHHERLDEIGRASCRKRAQTWAMGGSRTQHQARPTLTTGERGL